MSKHVQNAKSKSKQDPMAVDDENTIDLTKEHDVVMADDDQKDIDPPDSNQNTTNNDDTNNTTKIQKEQKGKEDVQSQPVSNQPVQNQPVAPPPTAQQAQFKYVWQWMENDGTWHDYDTTTQLQLDMLSIGNKITISAGQWTYDITRTATDQCSLCFLYFIHLLPVFTPCPYSVYLLSMYTLCGQSKTIRFQTDSLHKFTENTLEIQSEERPNSKGAMVPTSTGPIEWTFKFIESNESIDIESSKSIRCSQSTKSMEWQRPKRSKCRTSAIDEISKWIQSQRSNQWHRNGTVRIYVAVFGE